MAKYSDILLDNIKKVDGAGSGIDTDLVRGEIIDIKNTNGLITNEAGLPLKVFDGSFKNKIINGDISVIQRGRMFSFDNAGNYTADRWYSEIQSGSEEVRQELVYSPDAGTWKDETDPFGDGSQHNLLQFDGDATDTNGNNDGTLNGDATFVDDHVPNIGGCKVLSLDGDGDYVSTDFKIGTQTQYTLSTWFKTDTLTDYHAILMSDDSDGTGEKGRGSIYLYKNNYVRLQMADDSDIDKKYIMVNNLDDNVWHNILISIDGNKQTLYIDGNNLGTYTLSISAGTASDYSYSIGRVGEYDGGYFKGQIARTRVLLDKALTQDEVYKLYVEDSKYFQKKHLKSIVTSDNTISKYQPFVYRFEGKDLIDYINNEVTISFNVASNQTGDFTLSLINKSTSTDVESYVTKFNYSDTTTEFQRVSITIPLNDFTKFIRDDNELAFEMVMAGIGVETDTEGIQDGEYYYLKDTIKLTDNDWISITDVQLEEGSLGTKFERRSTTLETLDNNGVKNQCTAWVVFDGNNGEIKDSYNINSVIRNDVGDYTLEYNINMKNNNYTISGTTKTTYATIVIVNILDTTNAKIYTINEDDYKVDRDEVFIQVFGGS